MDNYIVNDPNVPIKKNTGVPGIPNPHAKFWVQGYVGVGNFPLQSAEFHGAQVYITVAHVLSFVQRVSQQPIVKWSSTDNLAIYPHAGSMLNAFYDRVSIKFFYKRNPHNNQVVYTCESNDVVSHELGHAILDSIRPDLWSTPFLEVPAFHEAFSDSIAIMSALDHEEIPDIVLRETSGNLRSINCVSKIAEQMGQIIYELTNGNNRQSRDFLRCAFNDFKYTKPDLLPDKAGDASLSRQSHSFGRVFTGGFYDLIVTLYEKLVNEGVDKVIALKEANFTAGKLLLQSARTASLMPNFFESVVNTMIDMNIHQDCVTSAFTNRGIINTVKNMFLEEGNTINTQMVKTTANNLGVKGTDNPLYGVKVDVPEHLDILESEDICDSVKSCLDHWHVTKQFGEDEEFTVKDNELIRNYFSFGDDLSID